MSMTGKRFTRVDSIGAKLSKLNRFLVSEDMYDRFEKLRVRVLDRKWSDYCRIILHGFSIDCGLTSFKFFNPWLQMDGFDDMIKGAVHDFVVHPGWSKFVFLKNKLKFIKAKI